MESKYLEWARKLQALVQTGIHFNNNPFDQERYREIQQIADEMMAEHYSMTPGEVHEFHRQETGYATPKVVVRGVVFKEDAILMVREKMDGRWTLPGGFADVNEPPSLAVEREIFEESGYLAKCIKLLGIYDQRLNPHIPPFPFHVYKLFFLCEFKGGEAKPSIETLEINFFKETEIPEDLSRTRASRDEILRCFEQYRHPDWPTQFD